MTPDPSPDLLQLRWHTFERSLREALAIGGCDQAEADHVVQAMRPIYMFSASTSCPVIGEGAMSAQEAADMLNRWMAGAVGPLLQEIVTREVELLRLRPRSKT